MQPSWPRGDSYDKRQEVKPKTETRQCSNNEVPGDKEPGDEETGEEKTRNEDQKKMKPSPRNQRRRTRRWGVPEHATNMTQK